MNKPPKKPVIKTCPKCGKEHSKRGEYCCRSCANSRTWTDEQRKAHSRKMTKFMNSGSDAAERAKFAILKNKRVPPEIPIDPEYEHLDSNQFVSDGMIWTIDDKWKDPFHD